MLERAMFVNLEDDVVKIFKTLTVALGVALWLPLVAQAAEESAPSAEEQAPPPADSTASTKCLEAVVNPVTGYAICTNPRGAPVAPPPPASFQRPCKPRAHDDDAWTVYEHASGCGD
jgi:hypothetical protein